MQLDVNDQRFDVDIPDDERLIATLRDRLALTGAKLVCGRGECGACSVLLDGKLVYSCLTLTTACAGRGITTIEGLAPDGELHPLQRVFVEHDALQCGFCTPGQILAALALLRDTPRPTGQEIVAGMSGNLCRCGAYPKIVAAIESAAAAHRQRGGGGGAHPPGDAAPPHRDTAGG